MQELGGGYLRLLKLSGYRSAENTQGARGGAEARRETNRTPSQRAKSEAGPTRWEDPVIRNR